MRCSAACSLALVTFACVTVVNIRASTPETPTSRSNKKCGRWQRGDCVPESGQCGRGKRTDVRQPEGCSKRIRPCFVKCDANHQAGKLLTQSRKPAQRKKQRKRQRKGKKKQQRRQNRPPKGCLYQKGAWEPCNQKTKTKQRKLLLKKAKDGVTCPNEFLISRRCGQRHQQPKVGKKRNICKYQRLPWSDCDPETLQKTRNVTLISGDASCRPLVVKRKKCKVARQRDGCKYNKGTWGNCDPKSNKKTRTDLLKSGSPPTCSKTKTVEKQCRACQYKTSDWSECADGRKTRTRTLESGDPKICRQDKTITRRCSKASCTYGPWGKWSECQNGVKKRLREVTSGPDSCQRRAAKTKPCSRS